MWKENWLLWKYWSILANIQFVQKFPDIQISEKKHFNGSNKSIQYRESNCNKLREAKHGRLVPFREPFWFDETLLRRLDTLSTSFLAVFGGNNLIPTMYDCGNDFISVRWCSVVTANNSSQIFNGSYVWTLSRPVMNMLHSTVEKPISNKLRSMTRSIVVLKSWPTHRKLISLC